MLVKHQDWSSGSAGGRACFLYSSLGIAGLYNDMIGGHYVSDVSRIVLPLFVSLWLEDICLILPWMRYLLCAGARVISFYRVMHAGSQLCFSHLARSWLGFVSGPHTSLPQGAFTPDANKSRYSHVVGRLNILSLLASFAREIRFIRAWNSLHNRCEFASWEGLLPGSSSLVAKFIPVFVKVRSSIVQLQVSTYNCKTGANVSVPMCLGPPSRGQKAPLRIHKSCLLHMSSRTQHTGGIHKAVSCICNSNIQGCSTLGDPHPVLTVPSFPPPLTTENSLKNPCNVICTNK